MNDTLTGDWLTETPNVADAEPPAPPARRNRLLTTVGAVATAAVLAAGGTYALTHSSSTNGSSAAVGAPNGAQAGGLAGAPGGAAGGAPGGMGFAPTQYHLDGTITAIGASTVTVKTTSGTTTYSVTSATHLMRNGSTATLSQFAVGDSVRGSTTTQGGTVLNDLVTGLPAQGQGQGQGQPPGGTSST